MKTFTVAMLTRNRPRSVARALENLTRLDWPAADLEVVVVEDGSEDSAAAVVAAFQDRLDLRYVAKPHRGISASKNDCWRLARGRYVAIIADDYELPRDYLAVAARFFAAAPAHQVLTFNMRSLGSGPASRVQSLYFELTLWQTIENLGAGEFLTGNGLPASRAACFRRELFERVGGFDESLAGGEDFDLSLRLRDAGVAVHFAPRSIVSHYEYGGLRFFLGQRRRYAENYYRLLEAHGKVKAGHGFSLGRAVRQITRQYLGWFGLAARVRKLPRYLALSPGILLFLVTFWLSVRRHSRGAWARS